MVRESGGVGVMASLLFLLPILILWKVRSSRPVARLSLTHDRQLDESLGLKPRKTPAARIGDDISHVALAPLPLHRPLRHLFFFFGFGKLFCSRPKIRTHITCNAPLVTFFLT
jgi:hypothetical protein